MVGCQPFLEADIASFLARAEEEGWICDRWELDFLLSRFPQGCLVYRNEINAPSGYITLVSYGRSGWIGNLLVHPNARRRGIGRCLMEEAVSSLLKSGVATVWLTASQEGAGLYGKLGFVPVDSVHRWRGKAALNQALKPAQLGIDSISALDGVGWGEPRRTLLQVICRRARLYTGPGAFLCCQDWQIGTQIGPWSCLGEAPAGELLDRVLTEGEAEIFLDVPAGNLVAAALLTKRGFAIKGSSALMYLGEAPLYHPETIYALASMGSMG